jgi:hypothetical protein
VKADSGRVLVQATGTCLRRGDGTTPTCSPSGAQGTPTPPMWWASHASTRSECQHITGCRDYLRHACSGVLRHGRKYSATTVHSNNTCKAIRLHNCRYSLPHYIHPPSLTLHTLASMLSQTLPSLSMRAGPLHYPSIGPCYQSFHPLCQEPHLIYYAPKFTLNIMS